MENIPQNPEGGRSVWPIIAIIIVIAIGVLSFLLMNKMNEKVESENENNNQAQEQTETQNPTNEKPENININEQTSDTVADSADEAVSNVKSFTINSENFSFTPNEMKVKKGDTVKITLNNIEGFHDLVIDEFNVRTNQLSGPKTETIEFIADKTGTFEYYCSVGSHRQMGMKGNLIVE